jgi:hypothetical protein
MSMGDSVSVGDWPALRVPVITISSTASAPSAPCAKDTAGIIAAVVATAINRAHLIVLISVFI